MHHSYGSIDTNWDDQHDGPYGWGKLTAPFLNTLHPITGNLVEYAVRVRHAYSSKVVQQFIYKADGQIRKILTASKRHDPKEFKIENYSPSDLSRVVSYVRSVIRVFALYYGTSDEYRSADSLKCIDISVANLSDLLNCVSSAVDEKLSPRCGIEEAKQDVRNLVALMNVLEGQPNTESSIQGETRPRISVDNGPDACNPDNPFS